MLMGPNGYMSLAFALKYNVNITCNTRQDSETPPQYFLSKQIVSDIKLIYIGQ